MCIEEFADILCRQCSVKPGSTIVVACSGGADSVSLLLMLQELQNSYPLSLLCVHVEHGIRGDASREDASFVRTLCVQRGIPFRLFEVNAPELAKEKHIGLEAAARELRYGVLRQAADEMDGALIALAHHRRDQAETVLMHMMRGCDTDALSGMRWRDGNLIRPLLNTDPDSLKTWLTCRGIVWREDATNADTVYTRNRVRHCIIPEMEKAYPGVIGAICRLADAAGRDRTYFDEQIGLLQIEKHLMRFPCGIALPAQVLQGISPSVGTRAVARIAALAGLPAQNREKTEAVWRLSQSGEGRAENLEGSGRARLWRGLLILVRAQQDMPRVQLDRFGKVETTFGRFDIRPARPDETGNGRACQAFPAACLGKMELGLCRDNGYFQPFGRAVQGHVQNFLTKVPLPEEIRMRMPAVCSRDGEVLWIPGIRGSERLRENGERIMVSWDNSDEVGQIVSMARNFGKSENRKIPSDKQGRKRNG
ncbi:MAG: tRNA lysidine(34) synthetase TilS [Clostridia bacterium]|nr:tRNA lysidine(34) synthetase TilS [Clostridia bacterium]